MKKYILISVLTLLLFSCKQLETRQKEETILKGEATILVDESVKPIMEDLIQIFESKYEATIRLEAKSEAEVIQALANDTTRIAILTRKLNPQELSFFDSKKIYPKTTPFAKDAIAFIANSNTNDTLISLKEVSDFFGGRKSPKIMGLVFDNLNSSTIRYLAELSEVKSLPKEGIYSFNTNEEVINYVAKNDGIIGVVGINYIFEPSQKSEENLQNIKVLDFLNVADNQYYSPSQSNLAEGTYPLARELFIVNAQGYDGLGMGFASFIAGEIGQRIILKSGLLPIKIPSRKIKVRNTINNDKK